MRGGEWVTGLIPGGFMLRNVPQNVNHYETLGINPRSLAGLSDGEVADIVKVRFREIVRSIHPDAAGCVVTQIGIAMARLTDAKDCLADGETRRNYDIQIGQERPLPYRQNRSRSSRTRDNKNFEKIKLKVRIAMEAAFEGSPEAFEDGTNELIGLFRGDPSIHLFILDEFDRLKRLAAIVEGKEELLSSSRIQGDPNSTGGSELIRRLIESGTIRRSSNTLRKIIRKIDVSNSNGVSSLNQIVDLGSAESRVTLRQVISICDPNAEEGKNLIEKLLEKGVLSSRTFGKQLASKIDMSTEFGRHSAALLLDAGLIQEPQCEQQR